MPHRLRLLCLVLPCALAGCATGLAAGAGGAPTPPPVVAPATAGATSDGYRLVWSDDFSTDGPLNPRDWTYENGFVRNEELQWYQPQNARCENGLLVIAAQRESVPNPRYQPGATGWQRSRPSAAYTSASVTTRGLHAWLYGRFEMRARIDTRAGLWPAFWTLGVAGAWPACGEVDIMEYYRQMVLANVAWAFPQRTTKWHTVRTPLISFHDPAWSDKFHVWRMDWDVNFLRLYVDGQLLNETNLKDTVNAGPAGTNPFHQPHYLILNLAIGGQSGGDPAATSFPAKFEIDYVRVYQKTP